MRKMMKWAMVATLIYSLSIPTPEEQMTGKDITYAEMGSILASEYKAKEEGNKGLYLLQPSFERE